MSATIDQLAREAVALVGDRSRAILGIAGCPGAGKSTLVDLQLRTGAWHGRQGQLGDHRRGRRMAPRLAISA
jgi:putative protein kinase ArgK-like GTPase of G3E family